MLHNVLADNSFIQQNQICIDQLINVGKNSVIVRAHRKQESKQQRHHHKIEYNNQSQYEKNIEKSVSGSSSSNCIIISSSDGRDDNDNSDNRDSSENKSNYGWDMLKSFIVKFHSSQYPTTQQRNKFVKEYQIAKDFQCKHILKYYDCVQVKHGYALIMEDFFGKNLKEFVTEKYPKKGFPLEDALLISLQILEALFYLHEREIVHGRISCRHIIISENNNFTSINDKYEVKIIDLGFSTEIKHDTVKPMSRTTFDEELMYISPEQTGRMNHEIDYRTDFYSLGIVMYFMLSGTFPFASSGDVLELLYSHIASRPKSLNHLDSRIPKSISSIVDILLSKNADERYQSVFGISMDLKRCLKQVQNGGVENMMAISDLKAFDSHSTFHIKQKLYGRDGEVKQLLHAFEDVSHGRIDRIYITVSGYSGIGKTSLVNEIYKPLTRDKGFFISGKFDQFKRNIPFSSFIQAFQKLITILLSEPDDLLEYWRSSLLEALAGKGQIILDVIPQVELIIGKQPPVEVLPPTESENRFNALFQRFVQVFAKEKHPLVLFIDDLQWADAMSLKLLKNILTNNEIGYLFLIGAYRSNEVNDLHPLVKLHHEFHELQVKHLSIHLKSLEFEHINHLISDAFRKSPTKTKNLANIISKKTQGNPFFIVQMLRKLVQDNLITFNYNSGCWEWEIEKISGTRVSENVVEMLLQKLKKMPSYTQTALFLAASIGSTFSIDILSIVYQRSMKDTYSALWIAIKDGLVRQSDNIFKHISEFKDAIFSFLHDKVQQACYELKNMEERKNTHYRIGIVLLQELSKDKLEENIFDVISHFKHGCEFIKTTNDKIQIAEMCLRACKKAKECAAFHAAADYASFGMTLLPDDSWTLNYELTLGLALLRCECEYLRGNFDEAEKMYPIFIEKTTNLLHKLKFYTIKINHYEVQQRYFDAIQVCVDGLHLLGIDVPIDENEDLESRIADELALISSNTEKLSDISSLINHKEMSDEHLLAALQLLVLLWTDYYCHGTFKCMALASFKSANLCLEHGHSHLASQAYISSIAFLGGEYTRDYMMAYKFGELSLKLLEKYPNPAAIPRTLMLAYIGPASWVHPLNVCVPHIEHAWQVALENGDFAYATYLSAHIVSYRYLMGDELQSLHILNQKYLAFLKKQSAYMMRYYLGLTMGLRYMVEDMSEYEEKWVQITKQNNEIINLGAYHAGKIYGEWWVHSTNYNLSHTVLQYAYDAITYCPVGLTGLHTKIEPLLFGAIFLIRYYAYKCGRQDRDGRHWWRKVTEIIETFKEWSELCQANFEHKYLILKAELALSDSNHMQAIEYLEQAISSAHKHHYVQYEALGNEILGAMWMHHKKVKYAAIHIREAFYLFDKWGARFKVRQIASTYIDIVSDLQCSNVKLVEQNPRASLVDVHSIIKANQAQTAEMNLDQLLEHMMAIVMENAGAQRGIFVLNEAENKLLVLAEVSLGNSADESNNNKRSVLRAIRLENYNNVPQSIIHYVARTHEMIIIDNAQKSHQFSSDPFITERTMSIFAMAIKTNSIFKGVLYLENNVAKNAFSAANCEILQLIASHMVLMLENSKFSSLLESEKKNRRMEEFVDILCHEIKNPLNGILNSYQIVSDSVEKLKGYENFDKIDDEKKLIYNDVEEGISSIAISSEHLRDLVGSVLSLSVLNNKPSQVRSIPFKPLDIITSVRIMFKVQIQEKRLNFVIKTPPDIREANEIVIGDVHRIREILINLISNAVKFTKEGGTITVSFAIFDRENNKLTLAYTVADTGVGLTESEKAKLFIAFSQANEAVEIKYGGTGLGLKICHDLITAMGGTITVNSISGTGTIFTFQLPCQASSNEEISSIQKLQQDNTSTTITITKSYDDLTNAVPSTNPSSSLNGVACRKKILIVEDNFINQKVLSKFIREVGHQYDIANNGLEAIEQVKKLSTDKSHYDLIFMDISMPVMNGIEACKHIRQWERQNGLSMTPIVGVSAHSAEFGPSIASSVGMQAYIGKPYLKQDIFDAITSHSMNEHKNTRIS